MATRHHLMKIQQAILQGIKDEINTYVGPILPSLRPYYDEYEREFSSFERIATKEELIKQILRSDIVFSADYHTFRQSQRVPIRLLREVIKKRKQILLGVEMILQEHQTHLDNYLQGDISEGEFLDVVDYYRTWGFEWDNFRPIFEFAKEHKLPMIALNTPELKRGARVLYYRDLLAAKSIVKYARKYPEHLVYVIFGDLHLARQHLPRLVDHEYARFGLKKRKLTIFQNSEAIYWKLAKMGLEHEVDLVKVRKRVYCVMNSPPWIQLQSYIHWMQHSQQMEKEPLSEEEENVHDFSEQLLAFMTSIASFFKLPTQNLDVFTLHTTGDVDFLRFLKKDLNRRFYRSLEKLILSGKTLTIPQRRTIYLADLGVNHAAEEAAVFMFTHFSQTAELFIDPQEFFYQILIMKAFGFLGSKIINHKRICEKDKDFSYFLSQYRAKRLQGLLAEKRKIAQLALKFREKEKNYLRGKRFDPRLGQEMMRSIVPLYEVAVIIGHILGEKMYLGLMQGLIDREDFRAHFYEPLKPGVALQKYLHFLTLLKDVDLRYTSQKEHL